MNTAYSFTPREIGSTQGKIENTLCALRAIEMVYPHLNSSTGPAIANLTSALATLQTGILRYEHE